MFTCPSLLLSGKRVQALKGAGAVGDTKVHGRGRYQTTLEACIHGMSNSVRVHVYYRQTLQTQCMCVCAAFCSRCGL